jgi:hypothetical protein
MEAVPDRTNVADADRKRTTRRRLAIGGALLFVAAWTIAIIYSVTAGGTSPERLTHPQAQVAETACRDAQRALAALPPVSIGAPIDARASRVASENAILTEMIRRMRAIHPEGGSPAVALTGWLDDWQELVTAREHYESDLRTKGVEARFVEPAAVGIQPIADKMNDWILEQGGRTDSCNTGQLQAEVVEGPRIYGEESNS